MSTVEFVTGYPRIRPGFAVRAVNWVKARQAAAESAAYEASTRRNPPIPSLGSLMVMGAVIDKRER